MTADRRRHRIPICGMRSTKQVSYVVWRLQLATRAEAQRRNSLLVAWCLNYPISKNNAPSTLGRPMYYSIHGPYGKGTTALANCWRTTRRWRACLPLNSTHHRRISIAVTLTLNTSPVQHLTHSADITTAWDTIMARALSNNDNAAYAGPGGFNDPDMLEVGFVARRLCTLLF